MPNVFPDSRQHVNHTPRGMTQGPGGMWVPVFCANCGVEGGKCPEKNMTFIFWLCNACFKTHGQITGTMVVPDKVFFDKIAQEQKEAHGRYLSHDELLQVVAEDSSPLATLLKEAK